ncbi:hypothetical protein ACJIZ3_017238 [Penstemon smallii]|uniref:Uncharacterized protein n=1 Tax=Penstemon smallii TaxID=265156 RepID=A0ABD3SVK9_9LAMI
MTTLSPIPSMQDLKIKFQLSTLVFPSQETEKKSLFLPNIDQILNYSIPTAHFFLPNKDFPPEFVGKRLKIALEKVLVPYDFMAGRLKLNYKSGCLEIDCNGAGVGFVLASSEFRLADIGECLVHPNLGFQQLAVQKLDCLSPQVDQPLCIFQVTSFKCGGFAIGMSMNHILCDGLGAKTFIENLASQAFGHEKPLAVVPNNDRRVLAARSPPRVEFPHHEFLKLDSPIGQGSTPPIFDCNLEELNYKIFKLSPNDIKNLKNKAKNDAKNTKVTSFGVMAALLWHCKVFSCNVNYKEDGLSTLIIAIDIRQRLNPQLSISYSGNAVLPKGVSVTYNELEKGPFSNLVEKISEGAKGMTNEYAKSALDWLEIHRGVPHGDYVVSSWLRLGFDEVVYPWGKPIYSCPVVNHRKDISWVFSDGFDGGISALVALPAEEMNRFEALFHDFFT